MNLLIQKINQLLLNKDCILIAIDGKSCAGKTTLAHDLSKYYDCEMIHMDDFFLQPHQRTLLRFHEAGGNIDYERFFIEVIKPLLRKEPFTYQVYDCSKQQLGNSYHIKIKQVIIIEGTYALHPYFKAPYDLKIFMDIDSTTQKNRILQRPKWKHERFFNEWIPYEQKYFDTFDIKNQCDIIMKGELYEPN